MGNRGGGGGAKCHYAFCRVAWCNAKRSLPWNSPVLIHRHINGSLPENVCHTVRAIYISPLPGNAFFSWPRLLSLIFSVRCCSSLFSYALFPCPAIVSDRNKKKENHTLESEEKRWMCEYERKRKKEEVKGLVGRCLTGSPHSKPEIKERFGKPKIRFGSGRTGSKIVSKFRLTLNPKLHSANKNTTFHSSAAASSRRSWSVS